VVVIAEALENQDRRNQHETYNLVLNTKYMVVYVRKNRDITCRKEDGGEWVSIGGTAAAMYLPPHYDHHRVVGTLWRAVQAASIIGDLNCWGGTKKRRLEEFIHEDKLGDIGMIQHTHEQGRHKCRIDRVLTKAGGRP